MENPQKEKRIFKRILKCEIPSQTGRQLLNYPMHVEETGLVGEWDKELSFIFFYAIQ